jgi:hypothetical protein
VTAGASTTGGRDRVNGYTVFEQKIANCDARFEVWIEDLDAALDEINSLIDVQDALQSLTRGCTYFTWNGKLTCQEDV